MPRVLGIDIQSKVIRAALVRITLRKVEVLCYLTMDRSGVNQGPRNAEAVAQALTQDLRELLQNLGTRPDWGMLAIDGDKFSMRRLTLPRTNPRDLKQLVFSELEAVLPIDMDDAVYDYQPCHSTQKAEIEILAVASPRVFVESVTANVQQAGLPIRHVVPAGVVLEGLESWLPPTTEDGSRLILDINADRTEACFLYKGSCEFSRTFSVGFWPWPNQASLFEQELRQTLASYRALLAVPIVEVLVTGEGALNPNIPTWLQQKLDLPCRVYEPVEAPGGTGLKRALFARALSLAASSTLRGKRINIRQGELALRPTLGMLRKQLRLIGVCASAIILSASISTCTRAKVLKKEREGLRQQLGQMSQMVLGERTEDITKVQVLIDSGGTLANPLPQYDVFDILEFASKSIDESITHDTKYMILELGNEGSEGRFELRGTVTKIGDRDQIASRLQKHESGCFRKVTKGGVKPAIGETKLDYEIEASIECSDAKGKDDKAPKSDDDEQSKS